MLSRLFEEPPFRMVAKKVLELTGASSSVRAKWNVSKRPPYLFGLLEAVRQAQRQNIRAISAIEFGVAGGAGLLVLQQEADVLEKETGIRISVYGFDMGPSGLPELIGDHRDHPDRWKAGDYPMEVDRLTGRLSDRTTLILGDLRETAAAFFSEYQPPPVGFAAVDVDLYSSALAALHMFCRDDRRILWHVPMYFDDIAFIGTSRFSGELAAIEEFNDMSRDVKIDRWYGSKAGLAFPESPFLERLFVAHDLTAISSVKVTRENVALAL